MRTRFRSLLLGLLLAVGAGPVLAADRISFSAGGVPLVGLLSRPDGAGPFPAVVLLPGCQELAQSNRWADYLRTRGYAVLLVECAEGNRSPAAYGALYFLQALPFIRADRIGAIGWSQAAATLLSLVDEDETATRPRNLRHGYAAAIAFDPSCGAVVEREPPWRTWTPLIILSGQDEDPACMELVKWSRLNGEPVDIGRYPDRDIDGPEAVQRLPGFLSRYLQP